jgi:hypothetical protein
MKSTVAVAAKRALILANGAAASHRPTARKRRLANLLVALAIDTSPRKHSSARRILMEALSK